jgi:hypothetical protein
VDASAFADVYFVVNKVGEAKIVGFNFLFDIKENYRFEGDLERQIEKIIVPRDGWVPAEIRGQQVNSNRVLRVFFE